MKLQSKIPTMGEDGRIKLHQILSEVGLALSLGNKDRPYEIIRQYKHHEPAGSNLRRVLDCLYKQKRQVLIDATNKMVDIYD